VTGGEEGKRASVGTGVHRPSSASTKGGVGGMISFVALCLETDDHEFKMVTILLSKYGVGVNDGEQNKYGWVTEQLNGMRCWLK